MSKSGTSDSSVAEGPEPINQERPSVTGVTVYSWGADPLLARSGVSHMAGVMAQGGNVGHASVLLTIPNTPENLKLVREKLGKEYVPGTEPNHVPWQQKKHIIPSIDMRKQNAKPDFTHPAYQEDVIEVYFSWWPEDGKGFGFQTFAQDTVAERTGVHVDYDEKWKEYLQPDERRQTNGILTSIINKTISLSSAQIVHEAGTTPEQLAFLKAYQHKLSLQAELESIGILLKKLQSKADKPDTFLDNTEKRLISKFLPEVDLTQTIDHKELLEKVAQRHAQIKDEDTACYYEYLITALDLMTPEEKAENTLTASQQNFYDAIDRLRQLARQLRNVDLENASEDAVKSLITAVQLFMNKKPNMFSASDNSLLLKHYQQIYPGEDFPNKLSRESLKAFKQDIAIDISPKESGLCTNGADVSADFGLDLSAMQNLVHKGNLQKLNFLSTQLKEIVALKPFVEAAISASQTNSLSKIMLSEIQDKLKNIQDFQNRFPPNKPLKEDELTFLLELINDAPKKTSTWSKQMEALTQSPGFSIQQIDSQYIDPLVDKVVSTGLPPDTIVNLPLKKAPDLRTLATSQPGLDPKAMIEQMSVLTKEGKAFNIIDNNCSVASTLILMAGAKDDLGREAEFKLTEISNSVVTPTTVYQNALRYNKSLTNPNYAPPAQTYYEAAEQYVAQTAVNRFAQGGVLNYGIAAASALTWVGLATLAAPIRYLYPEQQASSEKAITAGTSQTEPTPAPLEKEQKRPRAMTFSKQPDTPFLSKAPTVQPQIQAKEDDQRKPKNN